MAALIASCFPELRRFHWLRHSANGSKKDTMPLLRNFRLKAYLAQWEFTAGGIGAVRQWLNRKSV
jgi:hypothetical protein